MVVTSLTTAPTISLGGQQSTASVAFTDLAAGWKARSTWRYLAWNDVKARYRRTVLGPFWSSMQLLAFVIGIGFLYGALFDIPRQQFLPFVALGMLIWQFIQGLVTDATNVFTRSAPFIRSSSRPLSLYCYRGTTGQIIVFLHTLPIVVLVILIAGLRPNFLAICMSTAAVLAVIVNGFFLTLWLGPLAARFHDVPHLVQLFMQMAMFITPVFWNPASLPHPSLFVAWNPFAWLIEAFREPLIGGQLMSWTWTAIIALTIVNFVLGITVFGRTKSKIAYWV